MYTPIFYCPSFSYMLLYNFQRKTNTFIDYFLVTISKYKKKIIEILPFIICELLIGDSRYY